MPEPQFKKLYADALIREANLYFKKKEYENAAIHYEKACRFIISEQLEKSFTHEAFRIAINAWISASQPEKASKMIESLDHDVKIAILKEVIPLILKTVDNLVDDNNYKLAIEYLNTFMKLTHSNDLLAELEKLNEKQLHVVGRMMNTQNYLKK